MKRNRWLVWSLGVVLGAIVPMIFLSPSQWFTPSAAVQAQTPRPSVTAPPRPTPNVSPSGLPAVPVTPSILPPVAAPPASTAPPAELGSTYADPGKQFKVGVLKNYKVSPLSGSVLIESPDGNVAYTVVARSQPLGNQIGLVSGYDISSSLAKIAIAVFQRGEGFQPAPARSESGGGAVMDWTGTLTIGGNAQPMRGVILVRPTPQTILLLLIAATQTGEPQVPAALAALATSLQPLQ